jgi:hypothetical protein
MFVRQFDLQAERFFIFAGANPCTRGDGSIGLLRQPPELI